MSSMFILALTLGNSDYTHKLNWLKIKKLIQLFWKTSIATTVMGGQGVWRLGRSVEGLLEGGLIEGGRLIEVIRYYIQYVDYLILTGKFVKWEISNLIGTYMKTTIARNCTTEISVVQYKLSSLELDYKPILITLFPPFYIWHCAFIVLLSLQDSACNSE